MGGRAAALMVVLVLLSCDAPSAAAGASASANRTATALSPSPSPSTMPRADETRAITDALASAGVRLDRVLPSKLDWLFGDAAPRTGTFEVTIDGQTTWVDVHILERTVGRIVACSGQPMTSEAGTFSVAADGRPQALVGSGPTGWFSAGAMYFAASDRIFLVTPDLHVRERLLRALALRVPSCRVPVDLRTLPWEQEVVDAIASAGGEIERVGGSKFESFLGARREARHFAWIAGGRARGAEVIFLERWMPEVRMCASPVASAPGFTRWSLRVDGKDLAGMEGSQTAYPLLDPRFFVLTFDADSASALGRGLDLRAPPC